MAFKNKKEHIGQQIDENIASSIKSAVSNNTITCVNAHSICKKSGITPSEIGIQLDLLGIKIVECQIGLFGPKTNKSDDDTKIDEKVLNRIKQEQKENRISCLKCWEILKELKLSRKKIGNACDQINIKIKPCQLGAF